MKLIKDIITSRNNPKIKWVASLLQKKGRSEARSFIADGEKLSLEALDAGLPVTHIIVRNDQKDTWLAKINKYLDDENYAQTEIIFTDESVFEKISTEKSPEGVISVIKYLDFFNIVDIIYKEEFFLKQDERAIILHSVRDPSNLGSVIRSAVAFGTEHIILTEDCADIYNPKTVRSAMGSLFKVRVTTVRDMPSFLKVAQECGRRVLAAELNERAVSLDEVGLVPTDLVMIGNEGHGIPAEVSAICDGSVYIPISERTESLNASVAAAIFMWEQRK
jgi:TrmH family RNA methyltransferase